MASSIATTFITFTYRRQQPSLQTKLLPFFYKPNSTALSFKTPPFRKHTRRFSVAATSTAPPASSTSPSDSTTKIPADNRIPATIITGFLGSGKVIVTIACSVLRFFACCGFDDDERIVCDRRRC